MQLRVKCTLFNSPLARWAFAITCRPSVSVRRKLLQKSSPLELLDQLKPNLIWIITRVSSLKIVSGDAVHQPTWPLTKNRTYGKIAGFWVITKKPLMISEIWHGVKMISIARSTYLAIWLPILELLPFFHQIFKSLILFVLYFKNYKR